MVWVKTPHGHCSTQFEKGTVTGVYSSHSVFINGALHHISDLHLQQRSASLQDDCAESSESKSNMPLFFSGTPEDSSAEPDEMDSGDEKDEAKNKECQVGTTGQEIGKSHPPLCRSM